MARALVKEIKDTRKNYIINGDMRISQRGTLFTSILSDRYSIDRMLYRKSGAMVHSIAQDTDVPTVAQAGYLFQNSLLSTVTTVDTSIASTDFCTLQHRVEGYNWANLAQRPCTLSFWVKSSQTGTYCVALVNSAGDRSIVKEYTISAANTWEYKVLTFAASPSSGTWNYTNGIGVSVCWTLAAGSNFQTTADSWQTGNFIATTNQVNATNTIVTEFRLTGLKLNEGSYASPFSLFAGDAGGELAACQRYYEKSYNIDIFPGAASSNGQAIFNNNDSAGSRNPFFYIPFKVSKRTGVPAVTLYNPVTGATSSARGSDGGNYTIDSLQTGSNGLLARIVSLPAIVSGSVQFTAEAEL